VKSLSWRPLWSRQWSAALLCGSLVLALLPASAAEFQDPEMQRQQVLATIEARLTLMPGVAAAKWRSGAPVLDAAREQVVLQGVGREAERHGLAPAASQALLALQMRFARDIQQQLHTQWREQGFPTTLPIPDLNADLRPQLDGLMERQLAALAGGLPDLQDTVALNATFAASAGHYPRLAALSDADRQTLWQALATLRPATMDPLALIHARQVLRVGLTGDYAPFSFQAATAQTLTGTDVELAQSLGAALGVPVVFIRTRWGSLLPDLLAGRFDLALGGVSVTAERAAVAAFSPPYYHGGKTFIARCQDGDRYATLAAADRPDVRLIVNPGGTNERFARQHFKHARLTVHTDNVGVFEQLVAGNADLMVTDDIEVALQTRRQPALCRATPALYEPADKAVLLPQNPALQAVVAAWLEREIAAGTPARLLKSALQAAVPDGLTRLPCDNPRGQPAHCPAETHR
jgi:cyclohexadienyl dehydratase